MSRESATLDPNQVLASLNFGRESQDGGYYGSSVGLVIQNVQSTKASMVRNMPIFNLTRSRFKAVFRRLTGEWRPLIEPKIASDQIATEMKAASIPSLSFFVLLAVASGIATFGLLANSAPAIIGAMIIAPLMSPIMGLSYGVVQASWSQIARSGITVFLGMVLVIAIGFLGARFIEIKVTGTEMLSRAFPSLLDLGVAMAAGAAGAFSLSRDSIRNSLAGVAISVSLVPPLAVAGIGLALGRKATADVGISFPFAILACSQAEAISLWAHLCFF